MTTEKNNTGMRVLTILLAVLLVVAGIMVVKLYNQEKETKAQLEKEKEIVLKDYTDMVIEATDAIKGYFHSMPKAPVVVKAVPEYIEKTAPGGYYQAPALDGSRPGAFFVNLYDIKQTPKYSMKTLTYHEATPGHHHQIAHSLENDELTVYRRFGYRTSAFSEGWALYSERLSLEAGLAPDPMMSWVFYKVSYLEQLDWLLILECTIKSGQEKKQ